MCLWFVSRLLIQQPALVAGLAWMVSEANSNVLQIGYKRSNRIWFRNKISIEATNIEVQVDDGPLSRQENRKIVRIVKFRGVPVKSRVCASS